jgi:hypothetical protein
MQLDKDFRMKNFIRRMCLSIILIVAWMVLPCVFWEANAQDLTVGAAGTTGTQSGAIPSPLSLKDCLARALKDNPLLAEARPGIKAGEKGKRFS